MINPDIEFAPTAKLVSEWQRAGYSQQFLRRLLRARLDAARFGAEHGPLCYQDIQCANVAYLERELSEMEAERQVAA